MKTLQQHPHHVQKSSPVPQHGFQPVLIWFPLHNLLSLHPPSFPLLCSALYNFTRCVKYNISFHVPCPTACHIHSHLLFKTHFARTSLLWLNFISFYNNPYTYIFMSLSPSLMYLGNWLYLLDIFVQHLRECPHFVGTSSMLNELPTTYTNKIMRHMLGKYFGKRNLWYESVYWKHGGRSYLMDHRNLN